MEECVEARGGATSIDIRIRFNGTFVRCVITTRAIGTPSSSETLLNYKAVYIIPKN
jgi:hypothetical protein